MSHAIGDNATDIAIGCPRYGSGDEGEVIIMFLTESGKAVGKVPSGRMHTNLYSKDEKPSNCRGDEWPPHPSSAGEWKDYTVITIDDLNLGDGAELGVSVAGCLVGE